MAKHVLLCDWGLNSSNTFRMPVLYGCTYLILFVCPFSLFSPSILREAFLHSCLLPTSTHYYFILRSLILHAHLIRSISSG